MSAGFFSPMVTESMQNQRVTYLRFQPFMIHDIWASTGGDSTRDRCMLPWWGFFDLVGARGDEFQREREEEEENDDVTNMEEDIDGDLVDIEALNYDDLDNVSKLQKTQRYIDIIQKMEKGLKKGFDISNQGMVLEDDHEYQLIVDCNALSVDIENEIIIIHNIIHDNYWLKFPELESLLHHQILVASHFLKMFFKKLLMHVIMLLIYIHQRKRVLNFVESRMGYIAPNLSTIVGSAIATKLMGTAGGHSALAKMLACNIQLVATKKTTLVGFSTATSQFGVGYIEQT
ncbi:hypothetical protein REPUB_Repub01dG0098200 [Reevesia pubescens]